MRAGIWKVISPTGSPSVVSAQSLSPSGRQRLCLALTSQSAGVPSCWARAINSIRSATYNTTRVGKRGCHLGNTRVALDPAQAFLRAAALALLIIQPASPHPRIQHAQRSALGRHGVGWMHSHAAQGLIAQRSQPLGLLAVDVSSVVSSRHKFTGGGGGAVMRCCVRCQCDSISVRQSTLSLSKKRYAATVSLQLRLAFGMLAIGSAANLSIIILARLFRRASPKSSCSNSVAAQCVDAVAN